MQYQSENEFLFKTLFLKNEYTAKNSTIISVYLNETRAGEFKNINSNRISYLSIMKIIGNEEQKKTNYCIVIKGYASYDKRVCKL